MRVKIFARALLVVACAAAASNVAAQQQPAQRRRAGLDNLSLPSVLDSVGDWRVFAPEGGNFSVELPGTPDDAAAPKRAAGRVPADVLGYKLKTDDGVEYEITRTARVPDVMYEEADFEENFLASLSESLVGSAQKQWPHMKLELADVRPSTLDRHNGREFELASDEYLSRVRVYMVDRAMVIVAMTGPRAAFGDRKAARFFGSFKLAGE